MTDALDLQRFLDAQDGGVYERALGEIQGGRKKTHWMWFIFPQLRGLGVSRPARLYGIASAEEARQYLEHPVLGARLRACAEAALATNASTADQMFPPPDDMKLRSCATLFAAVAEPGSVFHQVLDRFWAGEPDSRTVEMLG
ncbi:MAG TPA: DUF1810 domain-containing protein [Gemmatimonadales bacterium]|nr:DUF1810 domain-containing protein [Gemmatimonadales bacterium]